MYRSYIRVVRVAKMSRNEAQSKQLEVVELYRLAWSETEFVAEKEDLDSFGDRFLRHCANPDFVMAMVDMSGGSAGFAYGYTSVPGGWWRQTVSTELPEGDAHRWFDDCFEFAELAVDPRHQRKGLGAALHDELLADLPHQTAMLSTQQDNARARTLYSHRGWIVLIDGFRFPHKKYPYVILGLDLARRRATAERGT